MASIVAPLDKYLVVIYLVVIIVVWVGRSDVQSELESTKANSLKIKCGKCGNCAYEKE